MIKLGEIQTLVVKRLSTIGVYLGSRDADSAEEVLLPNKQVPPETKVLDEIKVFIYRDSEDRMIATTKTPKLVLDKVALLKVKQVLDMGTFLDWGLPKDLLLPFKEQTVKVVEGQECIVGLYIDSSQRLCATTRIYDFLRTDSPYKRDDRVRGIIYDTDNDLGALIAVDHKYSALIPKAEIFGHVKIGDTVEARVVKVREDGKLDLSLKEKAHIQKDTDAEFILAKLEQAGGMLPLHDKSSSEEINKQLNMSKGAFKKAVGKLYKDRMILITPHGIELLQQ